MVCHPRWEGNEIQLPGGSRFAPVENPRQEVCGHSSVMADPFHVSGRCGKPGARLPEQSHAVTLENTTHLFTKCQKTSAVLCPSSPWVCCPTTPRNKLSYLLCSLFALSSWGSHCQPHPDCTGPEDGALKAKIRCPYLFTSFNFSANLASFLFAAGIFFFAQNSSVFTSSQCSSNGATVFPLLTDQYKCIATPRTIGPRSWWGPFRCCLSINAESNLEAKQYRAEASGWVPVTVACRLLQRELK